jgi:prevent-host-death family protein
MRTVSVVHVRSRLSALLGEVARGEEIAITRHGRVIAHLVPARSGMAADAFRPFWCGEEIDLDAPPDAPAEPTSGMGRHELSPEDARKLLVGSVLRYADPLGPVADDERGVRK